LLTAKKIAIRSKSLCSKIYKEHIFNKIIFNRNTFLGYSYFLFKNDLSKRHKKHYMRGEKFFQKEILSQTSKQPFPTP
jgi:hypothetical protein